MMSPRKNAAAAKRAMAQYQAYLAAQEQENAMPNLQGLSLGAGASSSSSTATAPGARKRTSASKGTVGDNEMLGRFRLNDYHICDVLEGLRALPDACIDCVVTSRQLYNELRERAQNAECTSMRLTVTNLSVSCDV